MASKKLMELLNRGIARALIQICQVCGYTIEGDAPERCPICKASKEKFTSF